MALCALVPLCAIVPLCVIVPLCALVNLFAIMPLRAIVLFNARHNCVAKLHCYRCSRRRQAERRCSEESLPGSYRGKLEKLSVPWLHLQLNIYGTIATCAVCRGVRSLRKLMTTCVSPIKLIADTCDWRLPLLVHLFWTETPSCSASTLAMHQQHLCQFSYLSG